MIKRKSRNGVFEHLKNNDDLSVVDLGCGTNGACPYADVLVDRNDWSDKFIGKKFVTHDLNNSPLPFEDKEFDFCFASHILEHVTDPVTFCKEMTRISKSGYIEVPMPLIDNLVSGDDGWDPNGHKWWCYFNDDESKLVLRPRRHIVHKTVDIPELNKLYPFFRDSFVLQVYWEDSIELEMGDEKYSYEETEYDLSQNQLDPWILGVSVLSKWSNQNG